MTLFHSDMVFNISARSLNGSFKVNNAKSKSNFLNNKIIH